MRITDQAVIRLANAHTIEQLESFSDYQLKNIIERCREIHGTDQLLDDAIWVLMIRNMGDAAVTE